MKISKFWWISPNLVKISLFYGDFHPNLEIIVKISKLENLQVENLQIWRSPNFKRSQPNFSSLAGLEVAEKFVVVGWLLCLSPTLVALELLWVELSYITLGFDNIYMVKWSPEKTKLSLWEGLNEAPYFLNSYFLRIWALWFLKIWTSWASIWPGWDNHGVPGNQVPRKS